MKILPNPLIELCFRKQNNASECCLNHGELPFPNTSMQLKPEQNLLTRSSNPLFAETSYTLQPGEPLCSASRMAQLNDATDIVTHYVHFEEYTLPGLISQ